jgi:transcriptional regulator GlxA family with amidase domain
MVILPVAMRRQARNDGTHTDGRARLVARSPRRVLIVAVPPVRTLDLFGPVEVFGDANRLYGGDPAYEVQIISSRSERIVLSHMGTSLNADLTYRECHGPIDTLLVAGFDSPQEMPFEHDFLHWLRETSGRSRRFGSVCTGALVLAAAGLLDGRHATTHWNWCDHLARHYPSVTVDPNPIYVRDGNCYTSAGVTAGIDLALALVEEDLGRPIALKVAQIMVVFLRRSGGQSQFSTTLAAQTRENRPLGDLLAWLPDNIRHGLTVASLARRSAMSPRNFARLFQQELGKTPARHLEDLRLEAARRQLELTALSLEEVADASGFASAETLRRVFKRRLGVTPGQYRASFGRRGVN